MRYCAIIVFFMILFFGPAFGQAPEKRFVGNCSFSGFALVADSTYRGNIVQFDDRMGDGYNLTQLVVGYEILDGRGLVFTIDTIHSSTNFTADVSVTAKVDRGFEPFGSGQVYNPTTRGLIPPSSQEQSGLSPTQKARIDRHNVVKLESLLAGAGILALGDGEPVSTPSTDEDAWMVLDTTNNRLYYYDVTGAAWDTISILNDGNGIYSGSDSLSEGLTHVIMRDINQTDRFFLGSFSDVNNPEGSNNYGIYIDPVFWGSSGIITGQYSGDGFGKIEVSRQRVNMLVEDESANATSVTVRDNQINMQFQAGNYDLANSPPSATLADTSVMAWVGTGTGATPQFLDKGLFGGGGSDTNTNIANANLTADSSRTLDLASFPLTLDFSSHPSDSAALRLLGPDGNTYGWLTTDGTGGLYMKVNRVVSTTNETIFSNNGQDKTEIGGVGDSLFFRGDRIFFNPVNLDTDTTITTALTLNANDELVLTNAGGSGSSNSVDSIQYVTDTTSLTPIEGDAFINSTKDTLGLYSGAGWVLFYGGGGSTIPEVSTVTLSNLTLDTVNFNSLDHGVFHIDAASTSRDTLYFSGAVNGGNYTLDLDNVEVDTIHWPDNLMDANEDTIGARIYTAGKFISFYYDGTNYYTPQALGSAFVDTISGGDTLLLNDYPGAWAAVSMRKINGNYTGSAIEVTRASDDATQDIGFISTIHLDTASLNTFCSGTDCYVTKWYDQSGNSRNFSQSDTSKAPLIVQGGTIIRENALPAVESDGNNDYMQSTNANGSQSGWAFVVNVSNNSVLLSQATTLDDNNYTALGSSSNVGLNQSMRYLGSTGTGSIFYGDTSVHLVQRLITYTSNGSTWSGWVDGTSQTMNSFAGSNVGFWFGDNTQNPMVLFGLVRTSIAVSPNITQEVILYNSDQSGNRSAIETNINGYYSIY